MGDEPEEVGVELGAQGGVQGGAVGTGGGGRGRYAQKAEDHSKGEDKGRHPE